MSTYSLFAFPTTRPGRSSIAEVAGISPSEVQRYVCLALDRQRLSELNVRRWATLRDARIDEMAAIADDPAQLWELCHSGAA